MGFKGVFIARKCYPDDKYAHAVNIEYAHAVNIEYTHAVNIEYAHAVNIEYAHAVNIEYAHAVNIEYAHAVNIEYAHAVNTENCIVNISMMLKFLLKTFIIGTRLNRFSGTVKMSTPKL